MWTVSNACSLLMVSLSCSKFLFAVSPADQLVGESEKLRMKKLEELSQNIESLR